MRKGTVIGIWSFLAAAAVGTYALAQSLDVESSSSGNGIWVFLWNRCGTLGVIVTVLYATSRLIKELRPVVRMVTSRLDEHDRMWRDYCERRGIPYLRTIGRETFEVTPEN